VDLEDWQGKKAYAKYDNFRVSSERKRYKITSLGNHTGTADLYVTESAYRATYN